MNMARWIQISDLHFGDNSPYSKKCREALSKYLKDNKGNIDYIFITGDIIFAKKKNKKERQQAYNDAWAYIKDIYEYLWNSNDGAIPIWKRIFIVPGNHDIRRNNARIGCITQLLTEYNNSEDGIIEQSYLENTTSELVDFLKFYGNVVSKSVIKKLKEQIHYIIETEKLNVLHINTCLSSCNDGDDGKLIIGFDLLNNAIEKIKNKKPTIAIAHHNFDCLCRNDQKKLEILLKEKNIPLFLCGHAHERESYAISRANQTQRLDTFTCGTLMPVDGNTKLNDSVFYIGEIDVNSCSGKISSYLWDLQNGWHEDKDFGLVQDIKDNYRVFCPTSPEFFKEILHSLPYKNGLMSNIVSQQSTERAKAFLELNDKAKKSLSIYGIGITSVSKKTELFDRIIDNNGTIKLCMVDPCVFKNNTCNHTHKDEEICCDIQQNNFCVYATHIDEYIRKEYYDDVIKSYKRILEYKKTLGVKKHMFSVRIVRSFIPLSINIINEDDINSELIIEYNMPFTTNRLLIELSNNKNPGYYQHIKNTFNKIWDMAEEVEFDVD